MTREHHTLFIARISDKTDEDDLISFFSKFGPIESYTFLSKNSRRSSASAIITYGLSVNVNSIIKQNQGIMFDNSRLFLRQMLPKTLPGLENFLSSNGLVISLDYLNSDKEFNEINLQKYFSKYGTIVSCQIIIPNRAFLLGFIKSNSVYLAITDEPHFYNGYYLILRKYISPTRINNFYLRNMKSYENIGKRRTDRLKTIRDLKDIIEIQKFGQQIQLNIMKHSYEQKKNKSHKKGNDDSIKVITQLRKNCHDINKNIERMTIKNSLLRSMIKEIQGQKKITIDFYMKEIQNEQSRVEELKNSVELLSSF